LPKDKDLVFVGDVHLDRDDPDLPAFLAYLRGLARTAGRIVLMGDLFNLWIGSEELEQAHHREVAGCLAALRRAGVETHYLEGNRDYRVARSHAGATFDAVSGAGLDESWGGRRLFAAHGDLVNAADRQYRLWRRLSRSRTAWLAFSAVPRKRRFAIAERLERSLRGTNRERKAAFPEDAVRGWAAPYFARGYDAVVLGHFHVEREIVHEAGGRPGRIFVLPEWKGSRRHLRVGAGGSIAFEECGGA
jgi:UDP-2,3-diacylglucosamine hydrolase